jgi:ribosomal protein S18 acetylase RimI-like enzyme
MITTPVLTSDYRATITRFYQKDPVFIQQYHSQRDNGFDACVDSCVRGFDACPEDKTKMLIVTKDDHEVGFFTLMEDAEVNGAILYQFFILPEYRSSALKTEMLELVKSKEEKDIYAIVLKENEPVMRFYGKMGSNILEFKSNGLNLVLFNLKRG